MRGKKSHHMTDGEAQVMQSEAKAEGVEGFITKSHGLPAGISIQSNTSQ
jgi:hypothetical protein